MTILAIDTSAALCAASVFDPVSMRELGRAVLDLGKGHVEQIVPVIEEALAAAGLSYDELSAISVSIGPGSFTGVRVGVSAARGLALALKIPATSVTTSEALAAEARSHWPGRNILVITKAANQVALAEFDETGAHLSGPVLATIAEAAERALSGKPVLAGNRSAEVAGETGKAFDLGPGGATADIRFYAEVAAARSGLYGDAPVPFYLRPPDALPNAKFAVAIKGD